MKKIRWHHHNHLESMNVDVEDNHFELADLIQKTLKKFFKDKADENYVIRDVSVNKVGDILTLGVYKYEPIESSGFRNVVEDYEISIVKVK